jgi:hypothetical protein
LAGEGLIEAFCEGFGFQGFIFRFVSILGERYTHGHIFDFYKFKSHLLELAEEGTDENSKLAVTDQSIDGSIAIQDQLGNLYDRLVLEIWTNGTVSPEMALVEAAKILRKHINPFVQVHPFNLQGSIFAD